MNKITGEQMAYALRWAADYLGQNCEAGDDTDKSCRELNYCAGKFEEDYQRLINLSRPVVTNLGSIKTAACGAVSAASGAGGTVIGGGSGEGGTWANLDVKEI